jgi:ATP-dependent Lon protease
VKVPHGKGVAIRRYTREAGVRNLERELSSLIRKAVKELALYNKQSITVEANTVADYLGVPKFRSLGTLEDGDLRSRAADRSRCSIRYR